MIYCISSIQAACNEAVKMATKFGNRGMAKFVNAMLRNSIRRRSQFIILETKQGFQKKDLKPGEKPEALFALADGDEAVAAYEYCNLHGLWKAEI